MNNRNNICTSIVVGFAFAFALVAEASPRAEDGPSYLFSAASSNPSGDGENLPAITIHSTDNVIRGKTGSFVLNMKPALMLGGTYVNFKISGTAVAGVDYELLVSPAYIGQSGYGVIQVKTLPDPRGSSFRRTYSLTVTLEPGEGYALGAARSATMWIKP